MLMVDMLIFWPMSLACDKFVWLNLDQRGDPNVCLIDLLALVQNE